MLCCFRKREQLRGAVVAHLRQPCVKQAGAEDHRRDVHVRASELGVGGERGLQNGAIVLV